MTTYILHGGFSKERNESNDRLFTKIASHVSSGIVLHVYFATMEEETIQGRYEKGVTYLSDMAQGKEIVSELAHADTFMEQVSRADVVFVSGGSTNKLMEALQTYKGLKDALEGKLVIGSSAGAYAISLFNYDKSHKTIRNGLGLLPKKVVCHYESTTDERVGDDAVAVMEASHPELELIVLKDGQWQERTA